MGTLFSRLLSPKRGTLIIDHFPVEITGNFLNKWATFLKYLIQVFGLKQHHIGDYEIATNDWTCQIHWFSQVCLQVSPVAQLHNQLSYSHKPLHTLRSSVCEGAEHVKNYRAHINMPSVVEWWRHQPCKHLIVELILPGCQIISLYPPLFLLLVTELLSYVESKQWHSRIARYRSN